MWWIRFPPYRTVMRIPLQGKSEQLLHNLRMLPSVVCQNFVRIQNLVCLRKNSKIYKSITQIFFSKTFFLQSSGDASGGLDKISKLFITVKVITFSWMWRWDPQIALTVSYCISLMLLSSKHRFSSNIASLNFCFLVIVFSSLLYFRLVLFIKVIFS